MDMQRDSDWMVAMTTALKGTRGLTDVRVPSVPSHKALQELFEDIKQRAYDQPPTGYILVPIEPTDEMISAGDNYIMPSPGLIRNIYKAMVRAYKDK